MGGGTTIFSKNGHHSVQSLGGAIFVARFGDFTANHLCSQGVGWLLLWKHGSHWAGDGDSRLGANKMKHKKGDANRMKWGDSSRKKLI